MSPYIIIILAFFYQLWNKFYEILLAVTNMFETDKAHEKWAPRLLNIVW